MFFTFVNPPTEPRKAVFSRLYRLTDTMFFNRYRAGPGGAGARAAPARGGGGRETYGEGVKTI